MERGRQQPPVVLVLLAVEQKQRLLAEHRPEDLVRRAHPEGRGIAAEHLPGGLRLGDEGAALESAELDGEDRSVAVAVALHEPDWFAEPLAHLPETGAGRAGREHGRTEPNPPRGSR